MSSSGDSDEDMNQSKKEVDQLEQALANIRDCDDNRGVIDLDDLRAIAEEMTDEEEAPASNKKRKKSAPKTEGRRLRSRSSTTTTVKKNPKKSKSSQVEKQVTGQYEGLGEDAQKIFQESMLAEKKRIEKSDPKVVLTQTNIQITSDVISVTAPRKPESSKPDPKPTTKNSKAPCGRHYTVPDGMIEDLRGRSQQPYLGREGVGKQWVGDCWAELKDPPMELEGEDIIEFFPDRWTNEQCAVMYGRSCNNLMMAKLRSSNPEVRDSVASNPVLPYPNLIRSENESQTERMIDSIYRSSEVMERAAKTLQEGVTKLTNMANQLSQINRTVATDSVQCFRAEMEMNLSSMRSFLKDHYARSRTETLFTSVTPKEFVPPTPVGGPSSLLADIDNYDVSGDGDDEICITSSL